ncbi:uncharacterized protein LOC121374121 isoform X2 [Gigantopelta aegis]|nr:uncharacterized protein LOC121374121 isoform X2 [Gigantopelta aegis]
MKVSCTPTVILLYLVVTSMCTPLEKWDADDKIHTTNSIASPAKDNAPRNKRTKHRIRKRNLDLDLDLDFRLRSPMENIKPIMDPDLAIPKSVSIDTSFQNDEMNPEDGLEAKHIVIDSTFQNHQIQVETSQKEPSRRWPPPRVQHEEERKNADEERRRAWQEERERELSKMLAVQLKEEKELADSFVNQLKNDAILTEKLMDGGQVPSSLNAYTDITDTVLGETVGTGETEAKQFEHEVEEIEEAETDYEEGRNKGDYEYDDPKMD